MHFFFVLYINNTISGNGKQNNGVSSSGIISMDSACPSASLKTHIESYEDYYRAQDRDKQHLPFYTCAGQSPKANNTHLVSTTISISIFTVTHLLTSFLFSVAISLPRPRRGTSKHSATMGGTPKLLSTGFHQMKLVSVLKNQRKISVK